MAVGPSPATSLVPLHCPAPFMASNAQHVTSKRVQRRFPLRGGKNRGAAVSTYSRRKSPWRAQATVQNTFALEAAEEVKVAGDSPVPLVAFNYTGRDRSGQGAA
eukprot:182705-Chlamydomonas_euryale.AAC.10